MAALLAGCGNGGGRAAAATTAIDPTRIPSADGKISSSTPAVGYVFSGGTTFDGRGASGAGPCFNSDGRWDATKKLAVLGNAARPAAAYAVSVAHATRMISTNGLLDHHTGTFPISTTDRPTHSIGIRDRSPRIPSPTPCRSCRG